MGGHGHGHHGGEPYTVPDYRIYKVEGIPKLEATRRALASKGLKDPWLRNEVWRFDPKMWGTEGQRMRTFFGRGLRTGLAMLAVTLIGTAVYDKMYPSEHHGHGSEEHH